jgi:hypothetical protein
MENQGEAIETKEIFIASVESGRIQIYVGIREEFNGIPVWKIAFKESAAEFMKDQGREDITFMIQDTLLDSSKHFITDRGPFIFCSSEENAYKALEEVYNLAISDCKQEINDIEARLVELKLRRATNVMK